MNIDMNSIVVAILALIGTVGGSYLSNRKTEALIGYRIDQLEKKVDSLNPVSERVAILERDQESMWKSITDIKDSIEKLNIKFDAYNKEG